MAHELSTAETASPFGRVVVRLLSRCGFKRRARQGPLVP
jgi:hypothetical protein